jgi:hypothetical protein
MRVLPSAGDSCPCSEHNPGALQIRSAGLIQVCADGIHYRLLPGRRRDGRNGTGSGFQAATVRAHFRACAMPVMAGKSRRSSSAADNSPP